MAGCALALVYNGAHKIDAGCNDEDWKPATVRLRHQFGRQRAARDARDGSLGNVNTIIHVIGWLRYEGFGLVVFFYRTEIEMGYFLLIENVIFSWLNQNNKAKDTR